VIDGQARVAQARDLGVEFAFESRPPGARPWPRKGRPSRTFAMETDRRTQERAHAGRPRDGSAAGEGQVHADPPGPGPAASSARTAVGSAQLPMTDVLVTMPPGARAQSAREGGVPSEPIGVDHQADGRIWCFHAPCF